MTRPKLPALPAPDAYDIFEMSNETMEHLRANIAIGYTSERGPAWWAQGQRTKTGEWAGIPEGSHFDGPVPMWRIKEILGVPFAKGQVHITYTDENGQRQVVADERIAPIVNIRSGQVFSYPTAKYNIHPYLSTLHDFIEAIQYDQAVACGSVGLLKKGGQAFLQAVLPDSLEVAGYGYTPYLLGTTSVDLSRATRWATGWKAGVCDNTVNSALGAALTSLRIPHTANSQLVVATARERLGVQLQAAGESIGQQIDRLSKVDVSDKDFRAWLDEMRPKVKRDPKSATGGRGFTNAETERAERTRLWKSDPKVAPWAGTGLGILQLDNTWRTWSQGLGSKIPGGRIERVFTNLADGKTDAADSRALEVLARVLDRRTVIA